MKLFGSVAATTTNDAAQARVDAIIAAARAQSSTVTVKRPLFREAARAPLAPTEDLLDLHLEEELAFARRTLEVMGDALCDDPILLARHQVTLQSVDLVAQILGHIGSVIGSADRNEAVTRIGMNDLRARLTRHLHALDDNAFSLHRAADNPFNAH